MSPGTSYGILKYDIHLTREETSETELGQAQVKLEVIQGVHHNCSHFCLLKFLASLEINILSSTFSNKPFQVDLREYRLRY